jgi:hypothetical protein
MRWLWASGAALVALGFAACSSSVTLPGKTAIGSYAFTATQTGGDCAFTEQPDGGFTYTATLSFNPGTTEGFVTINDVSRDGGFDGTVMDAPATGSRVFEKCACNTVVVNERITVALLSESQRAQLPDGACPPNPLDGGVPAPNDAGVFGPGERSNHFDAPLACGVQTDEIVPGAGCKCTGCSLQYSLSGVKQ